MSLQQSDLVEVKRVKGKGRGVFARRLIPAESIIEKVPVLVLEVDDPDEDEYPPGLADYVFIWGKRSLALALGYGSLYNHSYTPNAYYEDHHGRVKVYTAIRDIQPGEEITINYNGEPECDDDVGFEVM